MTNDDSAFYTYCTARAEEPRLVGVMRSRSR